MSEEGRPTGRVDALLEELRSALADANGDEPADERSERLSTLADRAEELVATSETADLLEAVGLESDDEDPTGVARAIAEGDADAVRKLRSLLELAKYDEADPDARERLRETVDSAAAGATDDAEAGDGAETADGAETEPEADSEGGGAADETTEEQDTSGLARSLLDALAKNFDTGDDGEGDDGEGDDDEGDDGEGDDGEGDDGEEGSGDEDGEDDAEEPDEDESEKSRDGTSRGRKDRGDGTRHSTVPRSKRADFSVPARHSTMPKRDG